MGALRSFPGVQGTIGQPTAQVIDGSLKFDDGSSQYLGRTPGSVGNRRTWTASFWTKSNPSGSTKQTFFQCRVSSNSDDTGIGLENDKIRVVTGTVDAYITSRVLRDPCAWYHIFVVFDTTQSTDSDRVKVYVNSELDTDGTTSYPSQNTEWSINTTNLHAIGRHEGVDSQYLDSYLSQFYFIDGLALGPGYFGFTDPLTNTWRPRKFRAEGTTINDGTVWSSLASVSSGSFQGSYPATYGFNGTLTSSNRANGDTNGSSIDLDFSSKNIIVKNDIAIWSGKSSIRYSINGGEYISYSDATEKWKTIPFSGKLVSLKIKHGSDSEQPGFSGLAVDGVTMLDSTTTNLAFGTNGYYLPMDNQDDFEKDKSGKGNDWTKNNFSGTSINPDVLKDSPSGAVFGGRAQTGITTTSSAPANYCTLNPLDTIVSLTDGNLETSNSSGWQSTRATTGMKSGKFYWETQNNQTAAAILGISNEDAPMTSGLIFGSDANPAWAWAGANSYFNSTSAATSLSNHVTSDTVQYAFDADNGRLWFGRNGTWYNSSWGTTGDPANGANPTVSGLDTNKTYFACASFFNGSAKFNFGQKPFKYAPPQGYSPLNSASARPNKVVPRPDQYVGVTTYLGSSGNVVVDDLNHKPDAVIIKQYNAGGGTNDWVMVDSVRGRAKSLYPSATYSENTSAADKDLISFDRNGFTVGQTNQSAVNRGSSSYFYLAFAWKAGGGTGAGGEFWIDDVQYASAAAAGLDGGDLTVTGASVGTKQGFSIIKYTGSGNAGDSASHGLSESPKFIITKNIDNGTYSWRVFTTVIDGSNDRLFLNGTNAKADQTDAPVPTSSVFYVGANLDHNKANDNIIAYLWHDVPGLQKFGKFSANANANGPYVELGFRPAFVWVKVADAADNWAVSDRERAKFNPSDKHIRLNAPDAAVNDSGNYKIDYLSNGFKIRGTNGEYNANAGNDYVYMAWAEAPASNLFGGQSNSR